MTMSSVLSPLLGQFREDANVDFVDSSTRPLACWPDSATAGADRQLEDDLYHAFRIAGYAQLRRIGITHQNGCVTLRGQVPTYFLKQLAQSLASSQLGVEVVDNHIEVACAR